MKSAAPAPGMKTAGLSEADLFAGYLWRRYGLAADALERESTNCGNNITLLLRLLVQRRIPFGCVIMIQDATMQARMDAGLRKYAPQGCTPINYAAYAARVTVQDGCLAYETPIPGMWTMDRYVSLLLGEIPRACRRRPGLRSTRKELYRPRGYSLRRIRGPCSAVPHFSWSYPPSRCPICYKGIRIDLIRVRSFI